jgi:hypothetical protein
MHRDPARWSALNPPLFCVVVLFLSAASQLLGNARADGINGRWTEIAQPAGPPISDALPQLYGSIVYDSRRDRMLEFGGQAGPSDQVWQLSMAPGSNWRRIFPQGTTPGVRWSPLAAYDPDGDRLIIVGGGSYGNPSFWNDVWQLTLSGTPTWTHLLPAGAPPPPRQYGSAIYDPVGRRLIVFGGWAGGTNYLNDTWQLSLTGSPTWSRFSPVSGPPAARAYAQVAYDSDHNSLIVFGGYTGVVNLSDTWELSLTGSGEWLLVTPSAFPPATYDGVAAYDPIAQRLLVFGGLHQDGLTNQTWQLTMSGTPAWSQVFPSGTPPTGRQAAAGGYDAARNRLVVFAGYDTQFRAENDTYALDMNGATAWSSFFGSNAGQMSYRRENATAIDPETRTMYTFGGFTIDAQGDDNQLWQLPLASTNQVWTRVLPQGVQPTYRHGHRAVWDPVRHRMIVVGGFDVGFLNDVWAYTPQPAPSWTRLTIAGTPPSGRMVFGLAYDPLRDRLILVGGYPGFWPTAPYPYLNDVWSLPLSGPSANTWIPLSPTGDPPSRRWIYGMQYDAPRDRMMFFGGATDAGRVNDVWALSLGGSTSWTQILPQGGPPMSRSDHTMIYDPYFDRMVVFGGYDGAVLTGQSPGPFLNDVWSLSLSGTPSWSPLSPDGDLASNRDAFTAVFDPVGDRMVFMGGFDGNNLLRDSWALEWSPPVVPALASLVSSSASSEAVRLEWMVPGAASVQSRVEKEVAGGWVSQGAAVASGADRLVFEDRDVQAGEHLSYRLWLSTGGPASIANETSVDIPSGFRFALDGARPNPTSGDRLMVAYSLARTEPTRLEIVDLAGRRVASRDLSTEGAGRHYTAVQPARPLSPGLYLLRLTAGGEVRTAKVSVVR